MGSHLSDLPTAARNNLLDEVCEFIRDGKTKIDVTTSDGYAALHWAARNDHQNVVAILLAYNADSTITTPQGETAMQLAKREAIMQLFHCFLSAISRINRYQLP